ncbi:MAG TPA: hypothetical protein PKA63_00315 [Oligoflexia bacterium]|nr:hypothetical protein [Oligoflexia bacterium]HMP47092.1 hypothetical protein [Oligoflexia bacterium]
MKESISDSLVKLSDEQRAFMLLSILVDSEFASEIMASDGRIRHEILPLINRLLSLSSDVRIPFCLTLFKESLHAMSRVNALTENTDN